MYSTLIIETINRHLFVTSDLRFGSQSLFGHIPIRKLYRHIENLQRAMVDNLNSVIDADDIVRCPGDFSQNLKQKQKSMTLVEIYSRVRNENPDTRQS